jgi:cation transport regulator
MPYKSIEDLPENVRHCLPKKAQKIYLEAFNHAFIQYKNRKDQEVTSHKIAWSTVKKKYVKDLEGKWKVK